MIEIMDVGKKNVS